MDLKVLVVEDEIVIADELCLILDKNGYTALEPAISYNEAIRAFEAEAPQLVILDVRLSGHKSGLDVARYIREKSGIPLIFLTACGDPKSMAEIAEFEPLACLQKTFFKRELLEKVKQVMEKDSKTGQNGLPNFTQKEKAVLLLIRENLTTRQIADQMNVSESTVKNHRHNICKKLELPATTHSLVNWVLRNHEQLDFED